MKPPNLKGADVVTDDTRLARFNKDKESLLDQLRNEYERGPKSKLFDEEKAWSRLTGLAQSYFGEHKMKKGRTPAADRIERLREIAKVLNARGIPTARGGQWYAKSVANILARA